VFFLFFEVVNEDIPFCRREKKGKEKVYVMGHRIVVIDLCYDTVLKVRLLENIQQHCHWVDEFQKE
jgi:hypothetical protein